MIFKFNGGRGAVLCGKCYKILYEGNKIPQYIWDAIENGTVNDLPDIYCEDNCKASKKILDNIKYESLEGINFKKSR